MKAPQLALLIGFFSFVGLNSLMAAQFALTPNDDLPVACRELLLTQDIAAFAQRVCPSLQDYEAEAQRFGRHLEPDERPALERHVENNIRNLTRAAEQFVKTGKRFGFISPGAEWTFKAATAQEMIMISGKIHRNNETMPHAAAIRLSFERDRRAKTSSIGVGDYSIDLVFAHQFPGGWRILNGMKWSECPKGVVPENLYADMQLAASFPGLRANLTTKEDPALRSVAERIRELLIAGGSAAAAGFMYTPQLFISVSQERSPDRRLPAKEQIESILAGRKGELIASAEALSQEIRKMGVDFTDAEIVEVIAEKVQIQAPEGLPELFPADDLRVTLRLPKSLKESGEESPGGDYVIGIASAERLDGTWYLPKLRWVNTPNNADDAVARSIALENYVAKFRRLPPGTASPDIELLSLSSKSQRSSKLSDYRGKFVILEWWATWCGPCQEPMAKLQNARKEHPNWADQVEIITMSLDDERDAATKHLKARGWTNTVNFWADGGFKSAAAKAFRITAIPHAYLISTNGTIVDSDFPISPVEQLDAIFKTQPGPEKN